MVDEVLRQRFEAVLVAKDALHARHCLLALLDSIVARAVLFALLVVGFYLLELGVVGQHLGGAAFVDDPHRDLVFDGFSHGVGIDYLTKYFQSSVDRGAGEANVGGVRQ